MTMNTKNSDEFAEQVVGALHAVLKRKSAPLHEPCFDGNEWRYIKECLDSTFVSSVGKFVDRFESELANFTGAKYVVAVVNGTAALHTSLKLVGVIQNDEVLLPALSFIASANAISYCNAIPHFVDIEESTLGIDCRKLRDYLESNTEIRDSRCFNKKTGRLVRSIVVLHTFGHPADIDGLLGISKDFNISLVEDAAESIGSFYNGQHTGTFGEYGILSFNGNKTITTGGGGAILTNCKLKAVAAKHLTTTAKLPHAWEYMHDEIGFNYRLPNLNAALGCAQLENLPQMLLKKRDLFKRYRDEFLKLEGIKLFEEPQNCISNYWLQTLVLDRGNEGLLESILKVTNGDGYMTRPAWRLIPHLSPYLNCPSMDISVAESLSKRILNIPSGAGL